MPEPTLVRELNSHLTGQDSRLWGDPIALYVAAIESALAATAGQQDASAEQPGDGKLLLAGEELPDGRFPIYRLNVDGSPDVTFGDGGKAIIRFPRGSSRTALTSDQWKGVKAIAVQPDGRIVIAGLAESSYGFPDRWITWRGEVALAMLNSDGTLDSCFGDNGYVVLDFEAEENIWPA